MPPCCTGVTLYKSGNDENMACVIKYIIMSLLTFCTVYMFVFQNPLEDPFRENVAR